MSTNPMIAVARARVRVDDLRDTTAGVHNAEPRRIESVISDVVDLCEAQQIALEALCERLYQHFNGGGADHPELGR